MISNRTTAVPNPILNSFMHHRGNDNSSVTMTTVMLVIALASAIFYTICSSNVYLLSINTKQRLMSSKGEKRTIFYHITVILQNSWDKRIARSGDMYRDDSGILSLVFLNVLASQTLWYKILLFKFPQSVKTVLNFLSLLKLY